MLGKTNDGSRVSVSYLDLRDPNGLVELPLLRLVGNPEVFGFCEDTVDSKVLEWWLFVCICVSSRLHSWLVQISIAFPFFFKLF